ncbi:PadR family transcriptional regulator [Parablastomonas sp. CN1-191]|uniref:PadR family transcriptional regulator n=1 Tax=Parablastomonas sp. CN1-191 TaxID=3400908 RepID=UPI003BF77769
MRDHHHRHHGRPHGNHGGWKNLFAAGFGPDGPFGPEGPFGSGGPFGADFPFGGGRGAGGRGPGGRRGRMFAAGELRLVLLKLVADQPRHGYDLIKAIQELTGGEYAPSPGVVYPTLQMMLDEAVVAELPDDSARKVFSATDAGRAELGKEAEAVDAIVARLSGLGEERRSSPHRQLHRAINNLRGAVGHQRGAGLEADKVERIVDLIDEAARKIERL